MDTKTLSPEAEALLTRLRAEAESPRGNGFRGVYLDNARPEGMSKHVWTGLLSALEGAGLYRPETDPEYRGFWGDVKLAD